MASALLVAVLAGAVAPSCSLGFGAVAPSCLLGFGAAVLLSYGLWKIGFG